MRRVPFEGKIIGDTEVIEYLGNKKYRCKCIVCGTEFTSSSDALARGYNCTCNHDQDRWKMDMLHQHYNEWEPIEYVGNSKFKCRCSCGTVKVVSKHDLIYGTSKSCGHTRLKFNSGDVIGPWTVLKYLGEKRYLCRCECGKEQPLLESSLAHCESTRCIHARPTTDLLNKKFGEWTVNDYLGYGKWLCTCSCGKVAPVSGFQLIHGQSKSCGHSTNAFIDLTGQKFGELTVGHYLGHGMWECKCSCGEQVVARGRFLREGSNQSCGHLARRLSQISRNKDRTEEQLKAVQSRENLLRFIGDKRISLLDLSRLLGLSYSHTVKLCNKFNIPESVVFIQNVTYKQDELTEFIRSVAQGIEIITNTRKVIAPKELDIYIPDRNLAIEFNGNYWHCSLAKDKFYHQNKTIACGKRGIRLIHIFEYEWDNPESRDNIKEFLKGLLTSRDEIMARNTIVKEISQNEAKAFEQQHHLQGCANSSVNIGLFYDGTLVGIMTFGKPRFSSEYEYEIIRMCFMRGTRVIGGASKLFQYFVRAYNPTSVFTYADLTKFSGNVYLRLGFKVDTAKPITEPNYVWVSYDGKSVLKRYRTTKQKLIELGYGDLGDTEVEIMDNLGYLQVFDSGSARLMWKSGGEA